jgi:hypothetical protein
MLAEFRRGGNLLYDNVVGKGVDATSRKIIALGPKADIPLGNNWAYKPG